MCFLSRTEPHKSKRRKRGFLNQDMDPFSDSNFPDSLERHDALSLAFAQRVTAHERTVHLESLFGILTDMGRMPDAAKVETEQFLRGQVDDDAELMPLSRVEVLFNSVVDFQTTEGLSREERMKRFPRANEILDDGRTALQAAVEVADTPLVRLLLSLGAEPDFGGLPTALYMACQVSSSSSAGTGGGSVGRFCSHSPTYL